jgi:hypothetical protein
VASPAPAAKLIVAAFNSQRYAMHAALKHDADIIVLHVFEKVDPASNAWLDPYLFEARHRKIDNEHITETNALIKERLKEIRENELKSNPEL